MSVFFSLLVSTSHLLTFARCQQDIGTWQGVDVYAATPDGLKCIPNHAHTSVFIVNVFHDEVVFVFVFRMLDPRPVPIEVLGSRKSVSGPSMFSDGTAVRHT